MLKVDALNIGGLNDNDFDTKSERDTTLPHERNNSNECYSSRNGDHLHAEYSDECRQGTPVKFLSGVNDVFQRSDKGLNLSGQVRSRVPPLISFQLQLTPMSLLIREPSVTVIVRSNIPLPSSL